MPYTAVLLVEGNQKGIRSECSWYDTPRVAVLAVDEVLPKEDRHSRI
jgi:hypothetical protein